MHFYYNLVNSSFDELRYLTGYYQHLHLVAGLPVPGLHPHEFTPATRAAFSAGLTRCCAPLY